MTDRYSFSEQDDYLAVFAPEFFNTLIGNKLGRGQREDVLEEIRDAISQMDPGRPPHKETEPVESTEEVEKLYPTNEVRIFCRVIRGLSGYQILYALDIDPGHQYNEKTLTELDDDVQEELQQVGRVDSEKSTEEYLSQYDLYDEDDVQDVIDQL